MPANALRMPVRTLILISIAAVAACSARQTLPAQLAPPSNASSDLSANKVSNARLFVSDLGTSDVYIYTLPALKLLEIVTGFKAPQGECSDDKGNVWVTDGPAQTIDELQHAGRIEKKLSDTYGSPDGCAWNPKTGNLAVMNFVGANNQPGAVLIYRHAAGPPNVYRNRKQFFYYFGGYDGLGNLYVDGQTPGGKFILSEFPGNTASAKTIGIFGGRIYTPGMVEWDSANKRLVIGDQNCGNLSTSCLYEVALADDRGTIRRQTDLGNPSGGQICDLVQGTLWQTFVLGSDFESCSSAPSATYLWPYPAGGRPHAQNDRNDLRPFGAAVSVEPTTAPHSNAKKGDRR